MKRKEGKEKWIYKSHIILGSKSLTENFKISQIKMLREFPRKFAGHFAKQSSKFDEYIRQFVILGDER